MKSYSIPSESVMVEIEIKKSRFICHLAHADYGGDILCPCPSAALLNTSINKWHNPLPALYVKCPCPLGTIKLMGRNAQKINIQLIHIDWNHRESIPGICLAQVFGGRIPADISLLG